MLKQNNDTNNSAAGSDNAATSPMMDSNAPIVSDDGLQSVFLDILQQGDFEIADVSLNRHLIAHSLLAMTQSPMLNQSPLQQTPELWVSPAFTDGDDFLTSGTSPELDLLNTPVIQADEYLTDLYDDEAPLFPPMPFIDYNLPQFSDPASVEKAPESALSLSTAKLYSFSPSSPALHDFDSIDPTSVYPSPLVAAGPTTFKPPVQPAPPTAPPITRRKSSATGTRKGLTAESLVPIDAPTQPRKYITPSVTSRKELPVTFARKRARSIAFEEDDEEQLEPLNANATELEQIEWKRRQNTVAARRSRKRKLEYLQSLEDRVEHLQNEVQKWKTRASMCQEMLAGHGIPRLAWED